MKNLSLICLLFLLFVSCKEEVSEVTLECCLEGKYQGELWIAPTDELDGAFVYENGKGFLTRADIVKNGDTFIVDLGSTETLDIPKIVITVDFENSVGNNAYFKVIDPFYHDEGYKNKIYPYEGGRFAITLYCTVENSDNNSFEILFTGSQLKTQNK